MTAPPVLPAALAAAHKAARPHWRLSPSEQMAIGLAAAEPVIRADATLTERRRVANVLRLNASNLASPGNDHAAAETLDAIADELDADNGTSIVDQLIDDGKRIRDLERLAADMLAQFPADHGAYALRLDGGAGETAPQTRSRWVGVATIGQWAATLRGQQ